MALLILACVIILSLILIVLGLPGLWVMVATAVTYNMIVPGDPIGWFSLVAVAVLALVAELLEFSLSGNTPGSMAVRAGRVGERSLVGSWEQWSGFRCRSSGRSSALSSDRSWALWSRSSRVARPPGDATRVAKGALIGRAVSTALKIGIGFAIGIWIFIAAMR